MKPPLQDSLPFEHVVLDDAVYRALCQQTGDWADQWLSIDEHQKECTYVFMKHCSPVGLSSEDTFLPSIFVMWFLAFNDVHCGPDRMFGLEEILRILETNASDIADTKYTLANATRRLLREIYKYYTFEETARLRETLCKLIRATLEETKYAGVLPSAEDYLRLREHTIAGYPYIELFRLKLDAHSTSEYAHLVEQMETRCVRGFFLVNDLLSTERDLRKNKFNLVRCISNDEQVSLEIAQEEALQITHNTLGELKQFYDALIEKGPDDKLRRYATFLLTVQEGNRSATLELRNRYFGNG